MALDGAFSLTRTTVPGGAGADVGAPPPGSPQTGNGDPGMPSVPATGDDISASGTARLVALGLLIVGILLAWIIPESKPAFRAAEGFVLLTGFYLAAQAIERLLELAPAGHGSKQAKANRAVIFPGLGFILAVILAEVLGLYFVQAVGAGDVPKDLDVIITALAIGGGTKPLHDGIKRIEKAKETPPVAT